MTINNPITEKKKTGGDDLSIEVVARRLACENAKFFVYFDHVVDRAGFEVPNYLIVTPKYQAGNLVTGVAVLPIMRGKIGLVRIYRPALRSYSWEIPHGFVDEEQDEKDAALRELQEETGLTVKPEDFYPLGSITPDSGLIAARVRLFVAENCKRNERTQGELGLRELRFFSVEEFEAMISSSEIQDSFTISAWCKYRMLGR